MLYRIFVRLACWFVRVEDPDLVPFYRLAGGRWERVRLHAVLPGDVIRGAAEFHGRKMYRVTMKPERRPVGRWYWGWYTEGDIVEEPER